MNGPIFATAQQEAYAYLRRRILEGELPGGTKVIPDEVAEALSISRMPVREALRQLDADGLVTLRPNRRAVVTSLTAFEVEELFEIRTALEVLAVKFAVPTLTPDVIAELEALRERMDRVRDDPQEWVKRHDQFHQAICVAGGRKRLAQEVGRIRQATQPYVLMFMRVYSTVEMPGHEHAVLLEVLASGDVSKAQRVMRDHVARPGIGILAFLRERESARLKPAAQQRAGDPRPMAVEGTLALHRRPSPPLER